MKKSMIVVVLILALIGVGVVLWTSSNNSGNTNAVLTASDNGNSVNVTTNESTKTVANENVSSENTNTAATESMTFSTPTKAAHFASSTPAHGETWPAVPINIVIDFNFDLAAPSSISILHEGREYGTGSTAIDTNKLALRRTMSASSPNGLYTVAYTACWPDGSCHDGEFQFAIDRTKAATFLDRRNATNVIISLAGFAIDEPNVRVSTGTKITWQNDDEVGHYINTDGHPAHTYFLDQNSSLLNTGDAFSLTFASPGYYPYHCSAHPDDMMGAIIVE